MPWKKGQSGNPRGLAGKSEKATLLRAAFKKLLTAQAAEELVGDALSQAKNGNASLLKVILPYCEQTLPKAIEHSGKSGDETIKVKVNLA